MYQFRVKKKDVHIINHLDNIEKEQQVAVEEEEVIHLHTVLLEAVQVIHIMI